MIGNLSGRVAGRLQAETVIRLNLSHSQANINLTLVLLGGGGKRGPPSQKQPLRPR